MKIPLTTKWERVGSIDFSHAHWHRIYLSCSHLPWPSERKDIWVGEVKFQGMLSPRRRGPNRKSETAARQDAEELAIQLLLDIRDGTNALMKEYGIREDD
jgi:hypothetical protein